MTIVGRNTARLILPLPPGDPPRGFEIDYTHARRPWRFISPAVRAFEFVVAHYLRIGGACSLVMVFAVAFVDETQFKVKVVDFRLRRLRTFRARLMLDKIPVLEIDDISPRRFVAAFRAN